MDKPIVSILLFLGIFTVGTFSAIAQDNKSIQKDSLASLIEKTTSSEVKVDLYNELSNLYINDTIQKVKYANIAFDLAKENDYVAGQIESLITVAIMYNKLRDYDKCGKVTDQGFKLLEQFPDRDSKVIKRKNVELLKLRGTVQLETKLYYEAIETLNKAFSLVNGLDNSDGGRIMLKISYIYTQVGDYDLANKILEEAIPYFINSKDYKNLIVSYNNIGNNYLQKKDYNRALREFELGLKETEESKYYTLLGLLKLNRATCLFELGREDEALVEFEDSRIILEADDL